MRIIPDMISWNVTHKYSSGRSVKYYNIAIHVNCIKDTSFYSFELQVYTHMTYTTQNQLVCVGQKRKDLCCYTAAL